MTDLERVYYEQVLKAYTLYNASLKHLSSLEIEKLETPEDLEVLDAFFSRFERLIELILSKFSKTVEIKEFWISEWTLRDRLSLMEKKWYIRDLDLWFDMRWVRNKIAHEYVNNWLKDMYIFIINNYDEEIKFFVSKIKNIF